MKFKINIIVLAAITILSLSCINKQNGANANADKKKEMAIDVNASIAKKYISQIVPEKNIGTKSFSTSELNGLNYSKLFSKEGILKLVAYYDNRTQQINQPTKFEDYLIFEVTYKNSENAKMAFEQIKSDAELSHSKQKIELDEELNNRTELLKLGERYGGLITFNKNQIYSLVENCDKTPLRKSWLELEYMFTDLLKNKNGYVEVLKAGCDEGRYYGGKRKTSS